MGEQEPLQVPPGEAPSAAARAQVIGWENIELISDRPLEVMLEDMARLKAEYPDRRGRPPTLPRRASLPRRPCAELLFCPATMCALRPRASLTASVS